MTAITVPTSSALSPAAIAETLHVDPQDRDWFDSRMVAAMAGKRHDNVVRDIRRRYLNATDAEVVGFTRLNFEVSSYRDESRARRELPCIRMTLEGLVSMLAMYDTRVNVRVVGIALEAVRLRRGFGCGRTAWEGLQALALTEAESAARASVNGRGLVQRRLEKRDIGAARATLLAQLQPWLPGFGMEAVQ